ncbi:hypothetical protein [uncultured Intestinimonas sp.]|uniref:hypothetical protein n=1 Tax=uncultured Intestinimonas sp. TaxID=1689265 RepID=UPI0025D2AB7B|nr:hypothetical protein [uncultured Intestinimonas sp.]
MPSVSCAVGFGFLSFALFMGLSLLLGEMVFALCLLALPGVIVGTGLGVVQALKQDREEPGE